MTLMSYGANTRPNCKSLADNKQRAVDSVLNQPVSRGVCGGVVGFGDGNTAGLFSGMPSPPRRTPSFVRAEGRMSEVARKDAPYGSLIGAADLRWCFGIQGGLSADWAARSPKPASSDVRLNSCTIRDAVGPHSRSRRTQCASTVGDRTRCERAEFLRHRAPHVRCSCTSTNWSATTRVPHR